MSQAAPRTGKCPNCGATIEFKLGASRATVCTFCQAVVARHGQDFTAIGKVADLIPTGSQLSLGTHGKLDGHAFEVVGRVQYEWKSGVWDEWHLSFVDGRWGWLAEAQGRYYATFKVPPRPLPQKGVVPGASFFIEGLGRFTVSDVKQAKIVGIAGELPDPFTLGETPLTADMESEKGGFATLDFGVAGQQPALFVGKQVPFADLALSGVAPAAKLRAAKPSGDKLTCPSCAAPLVMRLPEQSLRVVCESCHNLIDTSQGAFQVIEAIERGKYDPRIPLGTVGKLRERDLMIVGWMLRSCRVEGTRYPWDEYLLWEEKTQSFLWLVESDGHWQLATPVSVAGIHVGDDAEYQGRRYRHFSSVTGEVELVQGEFYWEVRTGDTGQLDDYIAPPEGLSSERTEGELNWSHIQHLERAEVATAFNRPGLAQAQQQGVGELQPWPYEAAWQSMSHWMLGGTVALFALLCGLAMRPTPVFLDQSFNSLAMQASGGEATGPSGEKVHGYISPPFELGGGEALRIEFTSSVVQSWAYAAGAVINDASGDSAPFGIETSYYSGVEDGESWSEGDRTASEVVGAPGTGKTVLRADLQWDPKLNGPPDMRLRVVGDVFSGWQFLGALLLLLWPLLLALMRASFERARWENSNVHPSDSGSED